MNYSKFYIQFGKLLYAIAKSDGKVQEEEIDEFYRIVKRELIVFQENSDSEDNSIFSEFEFDQLVFADEDKDVVFEDFITFIGQNPSLFTDDVKELCFDAVRRVAMAYNGIVVEEQDLIDRLKKALDEV